MSWGPTKPPKLVPAGERFTIKPNGIEITYFSSVYSKEFYGPGKVKEIVLNLPGSKVGCDYCAGSESDHERGCVRDARVTGG